MTSLDLRQHLAVTAASLRSCLEQQQAAGIQVLPGAARAKARTAPPASAPDGVADAASDTAASDTAASDTAASDTAASDTAASGTAAALDLPQLRQHLGDCRRCKLSQHRTNIVFGVGDPGAEVMFVGEGPGRDEDLKGEPFVGRAGQLLTDIITKGMKLRRDDVYIANVVKCRPPDNRDPEPDEVESCEPFLLRQIELVKPRVVVALGRFAVQTLLRSTAPISRLRGQWHDYHGIRLMPTFHPAYLLRNPGDKRLVWDDIKSVLRELGRAVA